MKVRLKLKSTKNSSGYSLLELLVSLALISAVVSLTLPLTHSTHRVFKSSFNNYQKVAKSEKLFRKIESLMEKNRLFSISPYYIGPNGELSLLSLDLNNIFKLRDGQFCKVVSGGEKPSAWLLIASSGYSVVKGEINRRRNCSGFNFREPVYYQESLVSYPTLEQTTLIGVKEFFRFSLEGKKLWKRSLIKADNLVLFENIYSFSVSELGRNTLLVEIGFQDADTATRKFSPTIFSESNRLELLF